MVRSRISFITLLLIGLCCFSLPQENLAAKSKPAENSNEDPIHVLNDLIWSGEYQPALKLIQSASEKKSKGLWKNRWDFWRAYLSYKAGDYANAAKLFEKVEPEYEILKDYVEFYWALSLRDDGQAQKAIEKLSALKQSQTTAALKPKIDREIALSYCKAGDRGQGVDLLNQLIQTETSEIKTYHLRFDRANCLIDLGDKDEALASLKSLYLTYPEGDLNDLILKDFEKLGNPHAITAEDHIARAERLMGVQRYDLAADDFVAATQDRGAGSLSLQMQVANALFKARRYSEAADLYKGIQASNPEALSQEDQENWAKSYSRSDQFDKALALYQGLLDNATPSKRSFLLYKIAFITMDKGELKEANQKFRDLLTEFPKHNQLEQIDWYVAWNQFQMRDYDAALTSLDRLDADFPQSKITQRIPYWRARILEKLGKKSEAKEIYQQLSEDKALSYYGLLALKRLQNNLSPEQAPKKNSFESLPTMRIPSVFSFKQAEASDQEGQNRLRELLLTGLWEDFLNELKSLTANEGVSPMFSQLKSNVESPSSESFSEQGAWDQRYPAAYPTLVSLFAETRKLPMALAWAVMREESGFRPSIVSPARAIGLMQIIPPTGFQIARQLGRASFVPDDLYQPVTNIEFGVQYLSTNLKHFPSIVHTIASYNAGPEAVDRWTKARPSRDWDEFVEEIPYTETNTYVKKVLKSYYLYSLLYPGSGL